MIDKDLRKNVRDLVLIVKNLNERIKELEEQAERSNSFNTVQEDN